MNSTLKQFNVTDYPSFITFLEMLHTDFLENPETWENKTVDDFLEALHRYSMDIQGYYDNTKQPINANEANWRVFSDMLIGASMYE